MLRTAIAQMNDVFSPSLIRRAKDLVIHGYVLSVRLSDGLLKARVKGESNQIFDIYFDLKKWPATPTRCNCSKQANCEHAAAALIALQTKQSHQSAARDGSASNHFVQESVLEADDVEWYSDLGMPGNQFFSYQLGIIVDDERVSLVPVIIELVHRWDIKSLEKLSDDLEVKLPIKKGKVLKIKMKRIKPLLRFLLKYSESDLSEETSLKVQNYQLLLMLEAEKALEATKSRWEGTEALKKRLKQLSQSEELPEAPIPKSLMAELRHYQHQGLSWLKLLRENHFGGILADDMGLGKTVQALALLQSEKELGRLKKASLLVAPTSLVGNWFEEAKRFTPDLKIHIFHGAGRHDENFDDYDLIISTYGLVQRDKKRFIKYSFYYLILDEAQFIKNSRAKTTQVIQQLNANYRLCLTGTPLENNLDELWSLFNFLMPGLLGTNKQFRTQFRTPIEKEGDAERQAILANRVSPFLLRRAKKNVAKELPAKTEINHFVELSGAQRDLYEAIRLTMEKKVRQAIAEKGFGKSQIVLLDALLKLRQVCCDPRLVSTSEADMVDSDSAKMSALLALLDNLVSEGRRVLVFSQFTSMLAIIEKVLIEKKYAYLKLTGQTKNRTALVKQFQTGETPIFLISLKAGGTGLNLTKADTVIHYDPWWNPAVQDQATDRSHRIGQENPVFVYKLIASGTVEEAILKMQQNKRQLVESVLTNQQSFGKGLTEVEIDLFFSPLDGL